MYNSNIKHLRLCHDTTQTTDFLTATLQSGILHSITGMENAFTRLSQTQSSLALPVNKDS